MTLWLAAVPLVLAHGNPVSSNDPQCE